MYLILKSVINETIHLSLSIKAVILKCMLFFCSQRKVRSLKKATKEAVAKIKYSELEKSGKEMSFNTTLLAYLELCVSSIRIVFLIMYIIWFYV